MCGPKSGASCLQVYFVNFAAAVHCLLHWGGEVCIESASPGLITYVSLAFRKKSSHALAHIVDFGAGVSLCAE